MNFLNPHMFFPIFVHGVPIFFHGFSLVFPVFSLVFPVFAPLHSPWPGGDPPGSAGGSCGLAMWLGSGGQLARWIPLPDGKIYPLVN